MFFNFLWLNSVFLILFLNFYFLMLIFISYGMSLGNKNGRGLYKNNK